MVRVKICCISSQREAQTAIHFGANALGLVGNMPSGPGVIKDDLIHVIARMVPPGVSTFLLTSEVHPRDIIHHHQKVHTTTLQLVDALASGTYSEIRAELPSVKLVQVIHVLDEKSITEAVEAARHVDAILLDSGNPNLTVKQLGGTGRTHNWEISRTIRESISIPLFLAGGLHAGNVREAIDFVRPFGVDICSGVRTDGKLNVEKAKAFFGAVR